jgi:hypothetical protein
MSAKRREADLSPHNFSMSALRLFELGAKVAGDSVGAI